MSRPRSFRLPSGASNGGGSGADPSFYVFLLIGQSNMEGPAQPQQQDREENPRVRVLAYDDCAQLGRTYNEWYTASPPLHGCGSGVGPGDSFGKALAEAFPDATIGLVPCGVMAAEIDLFRKDVISDRRGEYNIPPDNHWGGAYEWMIERARVAQESGVIRGIIFHQGESDNTDGAWVGKVEEIVTDLKRDLGLGDIPFVAGELLYGGCCSAHNTYINQLPGAITNAFVASASGLVGLDRAHFDLEGQRELGARFGEIMIEALNP